MAAPIATAYADGYRLGVLDTVTKLAAELSETYDFPIEDARQVIAEWIEAAGKPQSKVAYEGMDPREMAMRQQYMLRQQMLARRQAMAQRMQMGQQQQQRPPDHWGKEPAPASIMSNVAGAGAAAAGGGVVYHKLKGLAHKNKLISDITAAGGQGVKDLSSVIAHHNPKIPQSARSLIPLPRLAEEGSHIAKGVGKFLSSRRKMLGTGALGLGLYGLSQVL